MDFANLLFILNLLDIRSQVDRWTSHTKQPTTPPHTDAHNRNVQPIFHDMPLQNVFDHNPPQSTFPNYL